MLQSGGAAVIAAPDHQSGFKRGVAVQFGDFFEEVPADFKILAADLFLQGDGMAGDNEGAFGIHGMNDAGDEVGQTLAHASAGFEEQGTIAFQRIGRGQSHGGLLGTVIQTENVLQVAAFLENGMDECRQVSCPSCGAVILYQSNHLRFYSLVKQIDEQNITVKERTERRTFLETPVERATPAQIPIAVIISECFGTLTGLVAGEEAGR